MAVTGALRRLGREMTTMGIQPIRKLVTPEIPDKLYFRIGDVARLCEVPAYVLRFWETEFPQLKPNKGGTGQRLYRKRDVEMALRIKSLLYDQGYTIPGARQVFKNEAKLREASMAAEPAAGAAAPQPQVEPAAAPVPSPSIEESDPGAQIRQQASLRALREELQSLLTLLQQRVSPVTEQAGRPAPRPHTLRPRLVLEPRPSVAGSDSLRLVSDPKLQGDLFSAE